MCIIVESKQHFIRCFAHVWMRSGKLYLDILRMETHIDIYTYMGGLIQLVRFVDLFDNEIFHLFSIYACSPRPNKRITRFNSI